MGAEYVPDVGAEYDSAVGAVSAFEATEGSESVVGIGAT